MRVDSAIDRQIDTRLIALDEEESAGRTPSGKLTASSLGYPLQWQVLKSLGVKPAPVDPYTMRKFMRGRHVEDWVIGNIGGVVETQRTVSYRDVVGRVDALVNTVDWDFKLGVIPVEVKSVTNAKYKRILAQKGTDRGHRLQAGLYALALDTPDFAVIYVASDDYRVRVHIHSTREVQKEIDGIIDKYLEQLPHGVPTFEPIEGWQAKPEYNKYPEWSKLTEDEIKSKLKKEYGIICR